MHNYRRPDENIFLQFMGVYKITFQYRYCYDENYRTFSIISCAMK